MILGHFLVIFSQLPVCRKHHRATDFDCLGRLCSGTFDSHREGTGETMVTPLSARLVAAATSTPYEHRMAGTYEVVLLLLGLPSARHSMISNSLYPLVLGT